MERTKKIPWILKSGAVAEGIVKSAMQVGCWKGNSNTGFKMLAPG